MRVAWLLLLCALPLPLAAQEGVPFDPGLCALPFDSQRHPIDDDCGIEGKSNDADKRMESRAKNNLCAPGPATWVTIYTFKKLRQATAAEDFALGADRSGARDVWTTNPEGRTIGEGSRVKLAGYVLRANTANRSGGENVNCKRGGRDQNDVHVHLAQTPSLAAANFCKAVVAEIIPHLRPDDLNAEALMLTAGTPVRVTGHLFYDGNHPVKCDLQKPANSRSSTWEIHPVYSVDVCKFQSLAACNARKESVWVSLADWIRAQEHDDSPPD